MDRAKQALALERAKEAPAAPGERITLHEEPEQDILLLGEMWQDARTMVELLERLAASGADYTGYLRVIRGAAERMKQRATRLIGDAP